MLAGNNDNTNHIPGYGGHVPGFRDRPIGSTFGQCTTPGIFNAADTASKMDVARIPKSMYHSGLRMSPKKHGANAVKVGAAHWYAYCAVQRAIPSLSNARLPWRAAARVLEPCSAVGR